MSDREDYIDLQRLANAEPPTVPTDAPRDDNDDPIFEADDVCISADPASACRALADPIRLETVQFLAGVTRADATAGTQSVTLHALAQQLAGCAAVEETDIETLKLTLHHSILPTLHQANAIHYADEEGTATATLETESYARLAQLVTTFVAGDER